MRTSSGRPVCVVDDDDAVRDSVRILLESHGLTVRDYASARAFLAEAAAEGGCLLLDLHMPEMSGLELLEKLRADHVGIPTIIMTGRSDAGLRARAQRAGAVAFLDKPVDEDELLDSIQNAFASSNA
ncbi:response regulator transcription factor [Parvibaculum sp.]|uniref:response regulator transcription factor n=1 Tax=Parvibaculum sp. TaxID=2024848 RepID=UPI002B692199|nr:response regulator [Parvibaculum sp.]HUD51375.1 response regulator [Parvibaculum sp.]